MIAVRQKYIIADGCEPACHVPEFFADARASISKNTAGNGASR
jgi:hypothetical protein